MYGNISKAGLVSASVLPATGAFINPWISVAGYILVGVTLVTFAYLKHYSTIISKKQ